MDLIEIVGGLGDENRRPFIRGDFLRAALSRFAEGLKVIGQLRREIVQPVVVPLVARVRTGSAENSRRRSIVLHPELVAGEIAELFRLRSVDLVAPDDEDR